MHGETQLHLCPIHKSVVWGMQRVWVQHLCQVTTRSVRWGIRIPQTCEIALFNFLEKLLFIKS